MKYLNTGRRNLIPFPEGQAANLLAAAKGWISAKMADGTIDCHYVFPEGNGGFTISNEDSHEAAMKRLVEYPLYPFFDWEVRPLCEWSCAYDTFIEWWKQQTP